MDNKVKNKGREDVEVMNSNVADDGVQFLDGNQERKIKKRKKYDDQGKQMKKKKTDAESQHEDYNEFKSNEDKDDIQYTKKEEKKKKLTEDNKSKYYHEFVSNEGGDDNHGKKRKDKKLREESKSKEHNEFESNEVSDDSQGKKRKKKKLSEESKSKENNEFESNEVGDDDQGKKRKKNKLSEERKSKEYNELESNEGGDDDQGKKMNKNKKLHDKSKSKEYNEFESNEVGDDDQGIKKKKLREERKSKEHNELESIEGGDYGQGKKNKLSEESKSREYVEFESNEGGDDDQGKKMKKKKKLHDKSKSKEISEFNNNEDDLPTARVKSRDGAQGIVTEVDVQSKMKTKKIATNSESSKPKRVTFSDHVDVCCDNLIRGKRFTPEEDEKVKLAVFDYIESHGLGDEGLDMVLHCKSHPEVKDCWKEIGAALPERPYVSVYSRAHILFERSEKRKWTPEELEFLQKIHEQHGSDWKTIAEAMGKHRFHVKDAWRRIKLLNRNQGRWTQEEYQNLFDLVNMDLRARASEDYRKSKHGMLRDNIGWEAIGDKLSTRSSSVCCQKWYDKLTSPMVANGVWSDTDDYRLVNALFTLDASCREEVDWDNLLEHRSSDVCRKRWNQMIQCIGEHGGKSFAEQVEILAKRFCPDLLEVRETFDAKPVVC